MSYKVSPFKLGYSHLSLKKEFVICPIGSHQKSLNTSFLEAYTSQTCRSNSTRDTNTFDFGSLICPCRRDPRSNLTTLNDCQHIIFLQVGSTFQTYWTNNKLGISTFKFGYPHLTLKEGSKVISKHMIS